MIIKVLYFFILFSVGYVSFPDLPARLATNGFIMTCCPSVVNCTAPSRSVRKISAPRSRYRFNTSGWGNLNRLLRPQETTTTWGSTSFKNFGLLDERLPWWGAIKTVLGSRSPARPISPLSAATIMSPGNRKDVWAKDTFTTRELLLELRQLSDSF